MKQAFGCPVISVTVRDEHSFMAVLGALEFGRDYQWAEPWDRDNVLMGPGRFTALAHADGRKQVWWIPLEEFGPHQ
jgi:hypothetical protein